MLTKKSQESNDIDQEHKNILTCLNIDLFTTRLDLKGILNIELTWTKVLTYIACQCDTRSFGHGVASW